MPLSAVSSTITFGRWSTRLLCEKLGVLSSTLSCVLAIAEIAPQSALQVLPDTLILWSSFGQQREWSCLTHAKEPLLEGHLGFIDSKNCPYRASTNTEKQNAFHNGWLHSVLVTGSLCYWVNGTPILAESSKTLDGYCVVADSAFTISKGMFLQMFTLLKDGGLPRASPACPPAMAARSNAIT
ncbi:hypothetical protein BDK51DRAFT_48282 [Blyttiomyces helicus]|uniref:DDE Tnp4 domain-containing protein n=1 Tax=Blyttiomyces helicus TaxID=388810 RepID=A0A4V1IRP5_9FUNG|nr:hypothetical protein BDK51DRAFT_48282 [Blyttiomyces helicus]|eukprot:RKO90777.1 hypothetical protein BDK51DRAFT_48282 [Blyttiomyces helicus]